MLTRAVCFNLWPLNGSLSQIHIQKHTFSSRLALSGKLKASLRVLRQMTSLALFVFCPWGWRRGEREHHLILKLQHRKQSSPGWKQMLKEPFGSGIPLLSAFTDIWFYVGKHSVTSVLS